MAYNKTLWKDRIVEKPNTYRKVENSDGTITLYPVTGQVIEKGTAISAANLNKIENGILEVYEHLENKLSKTDILTMANMGQDVKEAMTGGSVAIVGVNTVLSENIVNSQVTVDKTSFLEPAENLFNKNIVKFGYILNVLNGTLSVQSDIGFCVSDYIIVEENTQYTRTNNMHVCFYDSNYTFISGIASGGSTSFITPIGTVFVRITIHTPQTPLNTFMFNEGDTLLPFKEFSCKFNIPVVLNDNSISINNVDFYKKTENIFDKLNLLEGFSLGHTNGGLNTQTDKNFCVTDYLECLSNTTYVKSGKYHVCFYDSNKKFISGIAVGESAKKFTTPSNSKYLRITIYKIDDNIDTYMIINRETLPSDYIPTYEFTYGQTQLNTNIYENLKLCTYGDSTVASNNWQPFVVNKFGFNHYLRGIGGTTIAEKGSIAWVDSEGNYLDRPPSTQPSNGIKIKSSMVNDERINTIPSDTDIIIILASTNDFHQNVPLGNINDGLDTTYKGAYSLLLNKLQTKFPLKRIFICTPTQEAHNKQNTLGLEKYDYVKATKEVAEYFSIPIIDFWGECGWNNINAVNYLNTGDNIHPNNTLGGKRQAEVVISKLNSLNISI